MRFGRSLKAFRRPGLWSMLWMLGVAAVVAGSLLPPGDLPMLLDCVLDFVPASFSVLLYEFVLAGRDTAST